jgi:hypothetical protein
MLLAVLAVCDSNQITHQEWASWPGLDRQVFDNLLLCVPCTHTLLLLLLMVCRAGRVGMMKYNNDDVNACCSAVLEQDGQLFPTWSCLKCKCECCCLTLGRL